MAELQFITTNTPAFFWIINIDNQLNPAPVVEQAPRQLSFGMQKRLTSHKEFYNA